MTHKEKLQPPICHRDPEESSTTVQHTGLTVAFVNPPSKATGGYISE